MEVFVAADNGRLDSVVAKEQQLSRSFVNILLDQGKIRVNGVATHKPSAKVKAGDKIDLDFDPEQIKEIPDIDLPIIYQDDDCLVINKPVGVLTHSKGPFNPEATVSTFIRQFSNGMDDNRGGIVHRLDRVTSGVLICAKHQAALEWLQKQFSSRKTTKTYMSVVQGQPKEHQAIIDMPIERNPKNPKTFRVGQGGKPAQTKYRVIKGGVLSLIELQPITGRTHQLRVHLSQLGHPIVGDTLYGGPEADRVYLHAKSLAITLPSGQSKTFEAPLPPEFDAKIAE